MKQFLAAILCASLLRVPILVAQQPAQQAGPSLVLNLPNASLSEVIDILARQLKMNYILDPRVKGNVTVHTYGEVRGADVRGLLETILRVNGYSLVQVGDLYRIVPSADAVRLPVKVQSVDSKDLPDNESMVLNLMFLKFASAAEISKLVEPFLGEGAKQIVYEPANLLLLLDNARSMRRTMELVSMFDSDTLANKRIRLWEMKNSRPTDLARELDRVVMTLGLAQKSAGVQFLPIDRLNLLVAFAPNPGVFDQVSQWIDKLDVEAKPPVGGTDNYVFRVKYGKAESLAMAVTLLYLSQNLSPTDTFTYMYLLSMMSSLGSQQTAQAGAVPGQPGVAGMGGAMGGMYGGMGMGGMGLMGLLGGGMGGGMYGSPYGYPGMGMGMGMYGMPYGGGSPYGSPMAAGGVSPQAMQGLAVRQGDQTGQYLGGQGMQQSQPPLKIPRVIPNPFDNTLLIQATPQEYQQIEKLLKQIDVPPRQVLIEAKIYEVTLTDAFKSGVQAYLQQRGAGSTPLQLLGSITGAGAAFSAGWLVSQSRELLVFLQAQEDIRKTRVISAPSVIATDNVPASINVGTEVPVLTSQAVTGVQQGGSSLFTNTVQNRNTGVTLTITSRVQPSGIVTMVVNQEVSSPIAPSASDAIQSPSFQRRNVQTQLTVQDGDTIAIGGIIQENNLSSTSGIPGLVKIPWAGGLFGSKSVSKQRTELVIFLTPRVIYDTPQISEASEEFKSQFKRLQKMMQRN